MKIKDVTKQTGLTDRAVRFYIESGLVFPEHKENYAGRRSFEFSDTDVQRLSDIALLRSAGFSVEQIKKLFACENLNEVVGERLEALEKEQAQSGKTHLLLSPVKDRRDLDVHMILDALKRDPVPQEVPKSDSEPPYKKLLRKTRNAWIAVAVALSLVVMFLAAVIVAHRTTGFTAVAVSLNGRLLDVNEYIVRQAEDADSGFGEYVSSPLNRKNGHYYFAFTDYGPDGGTVVLDDGFTVDFGFFNTNNWHKAQIYIEIERNEDGGGKVKQTVCVLLDGVYVNETTFSAGDTGCSVRSLQGL